MKFTQEWKKTFEKNPELCMVQESGEKKLSGTTFRIYKKHGLFRHFHNLYQRKYKQLVKVTTIVGYVMDLGNLLDFATNRHALKIQKYFEKREQGAQFFLYPQETDRGIIKQYEARHLVDALEHEIVEICEFKQDIKDVSIVEQFLNHLELVFCKDACRKANERNKKKLAEYQKEFKESGEINMKHRKTKSG